MAKPAIKNAIICVDDEPIIVDALKDQLQRRFGDKLLVETSESGEDALELFKELLDDGYEVPVVVADYIMPGLKGDEMLARMHQISPDTRNILLTGQANIEGVANAVNYANLYRFITKPWDEEDLALTIKEAKKSYSQTKELKEKNIELARLNESLEKKVAERTKDLRELNATKDKFFSIIAHDLKNPFNALLNFSEFLKDNIDETPEDDVVEYLGAMHEAAKSGYRLLENLLDWSRAQTGRLLYEPEKIYLKPIITNTFELLSKNAEEKNIELHNKVGDEVTAWADENMINTVFRNLVSNAIKYSNAGGTIKVDAKQLNGNVEVDVTDEGIGISKENISRLFRVDSNLSTKGTRDEGGTGLGLILCKEFIERNEGQIGAESEKGKGSRFYFTLPKNASNP